MTSPIGTSPIGGGGGITEIIGVGVNITNPMGPTTTITATAATVGALMPMQYSDTGNRGPGAALRSGGDMFGNLTPGSAQGQPTTGGTIRRVSWRRTTTSAGFVRVSIINAGGGTERTFFLVTTGAGVGDGETSGLSVAVNDGEQIAVFWDSTSTGTTQDLAVTVYVEPAL